MRKRVLYIQYLNPAVYPPLDHSSRILASDGCEVLLLGIEDAQNKMILLEPVERRTAYRFKSVRPGWKRRAQYLLFFFWVLAWVVRWRPNWIYASDPLAALPAWAAGLLPGVRVIYHEHDFPDPKFFRSIFFRCALWARRRLARRAVLCVLPNSDRCEQFKEELGKNLNAVSVWNCPSKEEVSLEKAAPHGPGLQVVYQGTLVPSRLPFALLKALALLPESVRLRVIGYETLGHVGYAEDFQAEAKRLGVAHRVEWMGAIRLRSEMLALCRDSDVGLALVPKESRDFNFQTMAGASNKPFDYLACGLPVLVSDLPDWRQLIVEPGFGLACDPEDPREIAGALQSFLERPERTRSMGSLGRAQIQKEWNYEAQFSPVLREILGHG